MTSRAADVPSKPHGLEERVLLERFVEAFSAGDVDGLVALMTDEV